jgi:hypothetical protein
LKGKDFHQDFFPKRRQYLSDFFLKNTETVEKNLPFSDRLPAVSTGLRTDGRAEHVNSAMGFKSFFNRQNKKIVSIY